MICKAEPNPREARRPRRKAGLALLLLSVGPLSIMPLAAQDDASAGRTAFAKAERHASAQNHRAARVELLNAVAADPGWGPAHIALAMTNLRLFDPAGAEAELHRAAKLGVPAGQLRHLLGETYWLQGRYGDALRQLTANDLAPAHRAYAARIRGRVFLDEGNFDAARAAFDAAIAAGGDDAPTWTDIGRFRLVAGDMAGAIDAVSKALAIDGHDVRALEFRGRLVRAQYGLIAAVPWFEQALQESPDDVPVLIEYGSTLGDLGRHGDMLKIARQIVALQPSNPRGYFMQAVVAARAHAFALSKRLIEKTGGKIDDLPAMLLLRGGVEYGLGNDLIAAGYLGRLAQVQPLNFTAQALQARALYRGGDAEGAAKAMRAGQAVPGSYAALVLARALEAGGDRADAMAWVDRAQIAGGDAAVFVGQGGDPIQQVRAMNASGDSAAALVMAQDLLSRNPGAADAYMLVGDLLAETGDPMAAFDAYARAEALGFSPSLLARMVSLARRENNPAAVRNLLLRFLRSNPADVGARHMLADDYLDMGQSANAAALYAGLIAVLGPNDAALQFNYARALLEAGRPSEALARARLAYRVQPGNPAAVHVYGYVALKAGHADEAVEILQKAVALKPASKLARFHLAQALAARAA